MTAMQLETGSGSSVSSPSLEEIDAALAACFDDDAFVILSQDEQIYLQTTGTAASGFLVEYRDGSEVAHFQSAGANVPLASTQEIFRLYAKGDSAWRDKLSWVPWVAADRPPGSPSSGRSAIVLLAVAVVVAAVCFAIFAGH